MKQSKCNHKSKARGGTINTKVYPHQCTVCGMEFVASNDLKRDK